MSVAPYAAGILAGRTFLACLFLAAAVGKARAWMEFQGVLWNYRLLPWPLVRPAALGLVALEFATGLGLLGAGHANWPPELAAALLAIFAVAMTTNLVRGRVEIDCGCFQATLRQTLSWKLVLRNIGLICVAVLLALPQARLDGAGVAAWGQGMAAGLAFFTLYAAMNILWAAGPTSGGRGTGATTATVEVR